MIGILVFPDFQLLDAAGPISVFEIAARYSRAEPIESEIKVRDGVNTIIFDVKGDGQRGPSNDKFGNSRQATNP